MLDALARVVVASSRQKVPVEPGSGAVPGGLGGEGHPEGSWGPARLYREEHQLAQRLPREQLHSSGVYTGVIAAIKCMRSVSCTGSEAESGRVDSFIGCIGLAGPVVLHLRVGTRLQVLIIEVDGV